VRKDRPAKELKDFVKVNLKPGETKTVTFHVKPDRLAVWDEAAHAWLTPHDKMKAYICASSADVRGTVVLSPR